MKKYDLENLPDQYEFDNICVLENDEFKSLIKDIGYNREFIESFNELNFFRSSMLFRKTKIFSMSIILDSAAKTLFSIQKCCEYCNLADANALLRKYRDDIFFYLYVLYVSSNVDFFDEGKLDKHETNIKMWNENKLKDLDISTVLRYIAKSKVAEKVVCKYKLKAPFDKIGEKLNNFVHSNGRCFYNYGYRYYCNGNRIKEVSEFQENINYITATFLLLVTLVRNDFIASTDYADYLDLGLTPEEGSQYWVASFIQEYMNKNLSLIDENCKKYLRENTCMEIEL